MDAFWSTLLPRLPVWAIALAVLIYVTVTVAKIWRADEAEFLWGLIKTRRDHALRDALRQLESEVTVLGAMIPLGNVINEELADLIAEISSEGKPVSDRISKLYQTILAGATQVIRAKGYHRAAILFPEMGPGPLRLYLARTVQYSTTAQNNPRKPASIRGRVHEASPPVPALAAWGFGHPFP